MERSLGAIEETMLIEKDDKLVFVREPLPEDFNSLVIKVEQWAKDKEIFDKATPLTQHSKTQEEVDELKQSLEENNHEEIIDALGDILVTLIIQAKMNDLNLVDCLESAYNVISKRTGRMENGIFVKDK